MQQTPSRLVPPLSADIARLRRAVPLLCVVLSFGIGSLRCLAQDMRLQLPASVTAADIRGILDTEGDNLPSGVRKALRARLAELEGGTAAKAEGPDEGAKEDGPALPPEAKAVLGALDSLRSMERPAVLYGAHAAVQRADPTNAPAARLVWAVARHDWPVVGEVLRGLPTDVAPRAYARLLQSLARHVGPPPRGRDTSARHGISNRGRGLDPFALVEKDDDEPGETSDAWGDLTGPGAAFTPQDLDAILTLAPAPFDTTNAVIASVAAIAADAYRGKDASEALRARIRAGGLPGFVGGEAGRGLRSELLLHLGWHDPDALAAASAPDASVEDLLRAAHHACLATEDSPEALDSGVAALLRTLDAKPPVPLPELRGATERLLECLGTNGVALAAAVFDKRPDLGDVLLSGRMPAADGEGPKDDDEGDDEDDDPSHDLEARRSALTRQRVLGLALCRSGDPARRTLAAGPVCVWLAEVGFSLPKLVERLGERDRDRYYRSSSDPEPLERGALLAGAPAPDVVARLSEPLRRRARLTRFSVELLSYEEGQLAALRELAADYPDAAASMADTLLSSWARTKAPASIDPDELERMRYYAMMQRGYRSRTPTREGFPLTRGRQLRNLSELRALVSELRRIAGDRLDAKGVVAAFAASHSLAEVFTAEDIEAVFGARGEISRSVLADLVETMRTNLNEGWRKLDASAQSSAGRTSDEVAQEVLRGYGLAAALADEATSRPDAGWRDWDLRGKLYHDAAEFAYDQRAPLSEYTALRDAAFGSLRGAIAAYAAAEPSADDAPALRSSITPYMTWLTITLGASDGSLLTPNETRDEAGLAEIAGHLAALPPGRAGSERRLLAGVVRRVAATTPGHARFRLFEGAAAVLGANAPEAAEIARIVEDYRGILRECELRLRLDGSSTVGHVAPFSAHLLLCHTRQLGRESQAFVPLLSPDSERRKTLEADLRTALEPSFEIVSLQFHEPDVRPFDLPRADWQATPLLHLALRARGPAVDRVPPITAQLDFRDEFDSVVLPVASQVEPIDAAADPAPVRPCANVDAQTTVDVRDWSAHRAVLDVSVRADGLVPGWEHLYGTNRWPGLVVETQDSGPVITRVAATPKGPVVHCERTWQLVCRPAPDATSDVRLALPCPDSGFAATNVVHKRFAGTDLVTLSADEVAAGIALPLSGVAPRLPWRRGAPALWAGGAVVLAAVAVVVSRRRRRRGSPAAIPVPPEATPFAVLAYLTRVAGERSAELSAPRQAELEDERRRIEAAFFGPDASSAAKPDLAAVLRRWS